MQAQNTQASNPGSGLIGIEDLNLLVTGDFIEATGTVIKTKTGEISLLPSELKIITKSPQPMPLEHENFSDKKKRHR